MQNEVLGNTLQYHPGFYYIAFDIAQIVEIIFTKLFGEIISNIDEILLRKTILSAT